MTETSMQPGSMPPRTERRAHPRQKIQSLTYVELGDGNGGIALNVSEGGMTVVAAQPLDAAGTIDIAMQLPQTRKRLEVKGDVRWLSESRKEAGLQFVNLSSEALADIRDWMAREASPQPVDETFAPLPTYREPPQRPAEESFFADEDEVEEEIREQVSEKPELETPDETALAAASVKAAELETTAKKLERVFEAGHREMEAEATDAETFFLEPVPKEPARNAAESHAAAETVEAPAAPNLNGGARRAPFSTLASELPGAAPVQSANAFDTKVPSEGENQRGVLTAQAPSSLISSPPIATNPPHPLELPRPVFGSSYQTQETPEETGKDIRVHLQSGWVLGVLVLLLALISFFSSMAVRRGALNRMVGDGEPYSGARTAAPLTPGASPSAQNPATGANLAGSAPNRQVDIEIVDSANRKWTITMNSGGTLAPATQTASETPAQTEPANTVANTVAPPNSQPQTSAANPPVTPTPAVNNTKTTSNTDLSDATTSDSGNGGLLMTLPETPVAASSSIAISVRRFIPIPPDAAAHNRNLQVGSLANLVEPAYPAEAVQEKVDGAVKLRATISADGSVGYLDAESGPRALLPNSLTAVRNWRYNPTLLNGKPIETQEEITIVFRLPR